MTVGSHCRSMFLCKRFSNTPATSGRSSAFGVSRSAREASFATAAAGRVLGGELLATAEESVEDASVNAPEVVILSPEEAAVVTAIHSSLNFLTMSAVRAVAEGCRDRR